MDKLAKCQFLRAGVVVSVRVFVVLYHEFIKTQQNGLIRYLSSNYFEGIGNTLVFLQKSKDPFQQSS